MAKKKTTDSPLNYFKIINQTNKKQSWPTCNRTECWNHISWKDLQNLLVSITNTDTYKEKCLKRPRTTSKKLQKTAPWVGNKKGYFSSIRMNVYLRSRIDLEWDWSLAFGKVMNFSSFLRSVGFWWTSKRIKFS